MSKSQDNSKEPASTPFEFANRRELIGLCVDLQQAATALTQPSAFSARRAHVSSFKTASVTAWPGAPLGIHRLTVTQLAQPHKIVTCQVADSSGSLGLEGSFILNGHTIILRRSDSLADLSVKINAAHAGVTATVIHLGPQKFRMTLTGNLTGAINTLSAADNGTEMILEKLGLLGKALAIRQPITTAEGLTGAASIALGSATQTIAYMVGAVVGSLDTGTVVFKTGSESAEIAIDLNRDSLNSIAGKINAAAVPGLSAQVIVLPDIHGKITIESRQQLQFLSSDQALEINDPQGVLNKLGFLQKSFSAPLLAAQDAQFILDGVEQTRSTNVVSDILPGTVIKLLAGKPSEPADSELTITQDIEGMLGTIRRCLISFNALQNALNTQSLDAPTDDTDSGLPVHNPLPLLLERGASYPALHEIGICLDKNGSLQWDEGKITEALQDDPTRVMRAFGLMGMATCPEVQFITAGAQVEETSAEGFAVWLDTPPSQSVVAAPTVQTQPSTAAELITFHGDLFPGPVQITLPIGNMLPDTVNQINRYSSLLGRISASVDEQTGALRLSSLEYGTETDFTVESNKIMRDGSNSGIGPSLISIPGQDAAGTVNGEPMVGSGRTLVGGSGNNTTEGLKLLVSTANPGPKGHVIITRGLADRLSTALALLLEPAQGGAIGEDSSLGTQISDTQQQMQKIRQQTDAYADYLRQMYFAMEARIVEIDNQRTSFAARHGC